MSFTHRVGVCSGVSGVLSGNKADCSGSCSMKSFFEMIKKVRTPLTKIYSTRKLLNDYETVSIKFDASAVNDLHKQMR